ncbi:MAG: DUF1540 domain-containing protein [Bacillota bacterium]
MNQHIHCIVNDCNYWANGNKCEANEILVATDHFGETKPDRVDAAMAKQLAPEAAGTCMETCCKTYVPRGSDKITADSVTKIS